VQKVRNQSNLLMVSTRITDRMGKVDNSQGQKSLKPLKLSVDWPPLYLRSMWITDFCSENGKSTFVTHIHIFCTIRIKRAKQISVTPVNLGMDKRIPCFQVHKYSCIQITNVM
jgi:hypothetical protein